jgi:hypothetical protein
MNDHPFPEAVPTHFFTIVAQNYLAYAMVLGDSVLRHHPDAVFSIFLVDDTECRWKVAIEARGFTPIYPREIPLDRYKQFVFQYNVTEASTGVKPFIFRALFEAGAEKVIYLDPDMLCFRRFDEVLLALEHSSIVLTPHICSPASDQHFPGEKAIMRSGVFNLGFIALRRGETTSKFLHWWCDHLRLECIADSDAGLFVDQKWVDLVPGAFDHVHILRSLCYNIAYWNLHERHLQHTAHGLFEQNSGEPVALIHYSGFQLHDLDSICKYVARNPLGDGVHRQRYTLASRPDMDPPFRLYQKLLMDANAISFSKIPYAFGTYNDGQPISDLERSLFRTSAKWRMQELDPFRVGKDSFREACRQAGVPASAPRNTKGNARDGSAQNYSGYMRLIQFLLKLSLRILGPQKYAQFSKYMRHQFLLSNHDFLLNPGISVNPPPAKPLATLSPSAAKTHEVQRTSAR